MSEKQSEMEACSTTNKEPTIIDKPPTDVLKKSGIKPPAPTRIGRLCTMNHGQPKAGPPPPPSPHTCPQHETNMRRQSDEFNSPSHLSDVCEESESDLVSERLPSRFSMSRSPDRASSTSTTTSSANNVDKKLSCGETINSDVYLEATGRRHSSDHGVILTADTDSFIIGQRIWVGGIRPGHIAYIGETHFAPGDWAGVVLDEPNGKNDGCVAGKRYFQCEAKRGIFSRLTRLTREPLTATTSTSDMSLNVSTRSPTSPMRTDCTSPTQSVKSLLGKTPSKIQMAVGDRVIVSSGLGSRPGILKFMGETQFAPGTWCGVQLDEPTGKNDGSVSGVKYFECPPQYGIFVPVAKVSLSPSSRKARLSRSGSIESINSLCTVDSVTSTATSRMRSNMQRQSTSAKVASTPKNTFSLQDVLREKQNHIEQLLMERDLDRHDTESQIFASQKTINGLKEKITQLEKELEDEKRKTEDLQFSIDEVTYCRDEVPHPPSDDLTNSDQLTQKSGIPSDGEMKALKLEVTNLKAELDNKITELLKSLEANQHLHEELSKRSEEWKNLESQMTARISELETKEQLLQNELENVRKQSDESDSSKKHLEETIESLKITEHQQSEKIMTLHDELKIREAIVANYEGEFKEMISDKEELEARHKEISDAKDNLEVMLQEKLEELELVRISQTSTNEENKIILAEQLENRIKQDQSLKDIAGLQRTIEDKEDMLTNLDQKLKNYESDIDELKRSMTEKHQVILKHTEDFMRLKEQNDILSNQMNQTGQESMEIIQNLREENNTKVNELNSKIESLNQTIVELTEANSVAENSAKERGQSLDHQITQNDELQAKNNLIVLENSKLLQEVETLRNDLKVESDSIRQLTEAKEQLNAVVQMKTNELQIDRDELKRQSDQIQLLESERNQLKVEIDSLKEQKTQEAHSRDEAIAKYNDEIQTFTKQIDALSKDRDIALDKSKELEQKLDKSNEENREKRKLIEDFESELIAKNDELKNIVQLNEENVLKHQTTGQHAEELQRNLSKLEVDHADLCRKMTILEQKLEQTIREKISLQENLEILQNSSSDTNTEIARLTDQLKQKQMLLDETMEKSTTNQLDLEKRLHETQQNLAAISTAHEKSVAEIEAINVRKISRENDLNNELVKMKETYVEKKTALLRIEEELQKSETLKSKFEEAMLSLEQRVKELMQQLENERNTLAAKQMEFDKTEIDLKNIETHLRAELKSMQDSANLNKTTLDSELHRMTEEKTECLTKIQNQELVINSLESQIGEMTDKLAKSETNLTDLQKKLIESQTEYESLQANLSNEREQLQSSLSEINSKYKLVEDEQVDLVDTNERMKKDLAVAEEKIHQLQNDLETNVNNLRQNQNELQISQTNLENSHLQCEANAKDLKELIANRENLENQLTNLLKQIDVKNEDNQRMVKRLEDNETAIENLKTEYHRECDELNAKLKDCQMVIDAKNQENEMLQGKINQLTSSVNLSDDLKNELNHKSEEIRNKDHSITELNTTVSILRQEIQGKEIEMKNLLHEKEAECQKSIDELLIKTEELSNCKKDIDQLNGHCKEQTEKLNGILEEKLKLVNEKTELDKMIECLHMKINELNADKLIEVQQRTDLESAHKNSKDIELGKENEIAALKEKLNQINDKVRHYEVVLKELDALKQKQNEFAVREEKYRSKEMQLILENKLLSDKLNSMKVSSIANSGDDTDDISAQISFLNSIIADMHQKNEILSKRVQTLEAVPTDYLNNGMYDLPMKRKPAPRLFCDICDVFDAHETEECPLQSSESPPPNVPNTSDSDAGKKQKPPPRKYCDSCEEFGHDTEECPNDETY